MTLEYIDRRRRWPTPRAPSGPIEERWDERRFAAKLVNPANKRKHQVIVVGTGLAGGSAGGDAGRAGLQRRPASASRTRPRRAHSIAAQGGINAAKNYQNDGDSRLPAVLRHGQGRRLPLARGERLPPGADLDVNIIDQCVAQGVPFAREYGGLLDNRSFGGAQVSRTFYARGQTGQQLLLGAYQALMRQVDAGNVEMHPRTEMLDLVVVDGQARGIVARNLVTGEIETHAGRRGRARHRRLRQRLLPLDQRQGLQRHGDLARVQARRRTSPTPASRRSTRPASRVSGDHQSKLTLMSESLRNDGRVWVPKQKGDTRSARADPRGRARLLPRAQVPALRQPRPARHRLARGQGRSATRAAASGPAGSASTSTSATRSARLGRAAVEEKYGNLFEMYEQITGENPYKVPMRIYPAVHYTMGGLWVDYNLHEHHPRPVRARRGQLLRPRRQPARRLGADAGPGRRLLRAPVHARRLPGRATRCQAVDPADDAVQGRPKSRSRDRLDEAARRSRASAPSTPSTASSATSCGSTCGMARTEAGLKQGARRRSPQLREEFWKNVTVTGDRRTSSTRSWRRPAAWPTSSSSASCWCKDALAREESCGGHFREENQTPDGEAQRDDENFCHVAAWEYTGRRRRARCCTRSRSSSRYVHLAQTELQMSVHEPHSCRSGGRRTPTTAGALVDYQARRRQPRHVVPRDARRPQRAADPERARSRSPSTTTAARASAARAR